MGNKGSRAIMGLAILLPAAAGLGCTNSDVLSPGAGQLTLIIQASPAGSPKYELGSLSLVRVLVRPEDPQADAALGAQPYSIVANPISLDLTNSAPVPLAPSTLNEGVYRVVNVTLQAPRLQDFDFFGPNPPPATTCLDGVLSREGLNGALGCTSGGQCSPLEIPSGDLQRSIDVTFTSPPTFRVEHGGQGSATLIIDGTALISLFESAFTCRSSGGDCINVSTNFRAAPPCMSAYTSPTGDQVQQFLHFQ